MLLEFTKMHGLGNDFAVVDLISQHFSFETETVRRLADRRTGIGFDQLLLVEPPTNPAADFGFRIFNADGSEARQCGNGARCFARFVRDRELTVKQALTLEMTDGTLVHCRILDATQVEVDMGEPVTAPAEIPFIAEQGAPVHVVELSDGERVELGVLSLGNPHAVVLVDDVVRAPVERLGPLLQAHPAFPESVNVGFCEIVEPGFIRLRVYERGAGETQACGTGACAAVVAGVRRGVLRERVKVSLPGGKLRIVWPGPGDTVRMTGPTCEVYRGQINL